jgi:hypothetical protein
MLVERVGGFFCSSEVILGGLKLLLFLKKILFLFQHSFSSFRHQNLDLVPDQIHLIEI